MLNYEVKVKNIKENKVSTLSISVENEKEFLQWEKLFRAFMGSDTEIQESRIVEEISK